MAPARSDADLLETIVAAARRRVEVAAAREPLGDLTRRAARRPGSAGAFRAVLARETGVNVIAESKRRSPSRGVLRAAYDPVAIATSYEAAGAAAVSVLTEPTFFDGSLEHLEAVAAAVTVPVLRKDFVISEYQLLEARAAGAAAVLLIVAALTPVELRRLCREAASLGLDALVEVHTHDELGAAADAGADMIGVNNRNLRTLSVDLRASEALIASMPAGAIAVSESGLRTGADLVRLRALGYRAFLIGEGFMTNADPGAALGRLLGEVRSATEGDDRSRPARH